MGLAKAGRMLTSETSERLKLPLPQKLLPPVKPLLAEAMKLAVMGIAMPGAAAAMIAAAIPAAMPVVMAEMAAVEMAVEVTAEAAAMAAIRKAA
jgi:hypothetical protein